MVQAPSTTGRRAALLSLSVAALGMLVAALGQGGAEANVTAVKGSAYGCFGNDIKFGAGTPADTGPVASVTLPAGGSGSPIVANAAACLIRVQIAPGVFGPTIYSSGAISVSTQGTLGPAGSVTSTANITGPGATDAEAFKATSLSSTCTARETSANSGTTTVTGSTTVIAGQVETAENVFTAVPESPTPNFTITGSNGAGDSFRYVFNEQVVGADGSLTVNAVHLFLLGPIVTGDVIIGQVVCGVTARVVATTTTTTLATTTTTVPATTTTVPATTTTTVPATTTTTVPATTTTTVPATTTTTVPATTTTTRPATTTTTRPATTTTTRPAKTTTTRPATTTTTVPATTTTTRPATTTTTVPGSTTTTVPGDCTPGNGDARPGYGNGDKNHTHCGPPGQAGKTKPVVSTRDASPSWPALVGLGLLFLLSLVVPFRRSRRGNHRR